MPPEEPALLPAGKIRRKGFCLRHANLYLGKNLLKKKIIKTREESIGL